MNSEEPTSDQLITAYTRGIFPMANPESGGLIWLSPDPRAILPLDGLQVSKGLARVISSNRFEIRVDAAFEAVVRACAEPRPGREHSWIDERLIRAYKRLHRLGLAHSVEAWREGLLVGGLFGVRLGAAFFGESMFHRPESGGSNSSDVCLVRLVERLRAGGFELHDVQYLSPHLARLGCVEIPRALYLERLGQALSRPGSWPATQPGGS